MREHIHFVTGRLAELSLGEVLAELAPRVGFDYSVDVLRHHRGRADDDRVDRPPAARAAGHVARDAPRLLSRAS